MTEQHDIISALADGEPVEPDALARALDDPEARAYFIDLLILRGIVRNADEGEPSLVRSSVTRGRGWQRWAAAAAIASLCVLGGYSLGQEAGIDRLPSDIVESGTSLATQVEAPEPTNVIRFEPGVDWTSQSGGN